MMKFSDDIGMSYGPGECTAFKRGKLTGRT